MNWLLRRIWPWWVAFVVCLPALWGQTTGVNKVIKIQIQNVGPPAASEAMIRANIHIKIGDPFNLEATNDDVRTLKATGFFLNIRIVPQFTVNGVVLTYVLVGKPRLVDIKFSGNKKYSTAKLRKKVTSKVGEPLDEYKLFNDAREIQKLYQKAGYQQTKVESVPAIDENAGTATVTFQVTETPKVRILRVDFVGAKAFPQKRLRKVLKKTRKHWMFSWITGSGVLKDEEFEDDKDRLADFYRNKGYIDFEIRDVKFQYPDPKHMVIQIYVFEGKQYKVGSLEFTGNKLFPADEIKKGYAPKKGIKMDVGKTFTPQGLHDDIEAIRDFYGAKGYIDTEVQAVKNPNVERGTMDLNYKLVEHDKAYIEKVEIQGNTKTKDRVIRRELAVAPGEVFDMVKVKLSKKRLEEMNYFSKVETEPQDTDVPNRKNLVINVEETNTGQFTLGAGVDSIEGLVGIVEVTQGNFDLFKPPTFTGGGEKLRIDATIGGLYKDYELNFIEPWFLNRKLALGVDAFDRELDYLSVNNLYNERQIGATLSLTRALGSEFLIGSISYTMQDIGLFDVAPNAPDIILLDQGDHLESKFGASLSYDTRNSNFFPDKGQRSTLYTEVAGPFGGNVDFYKVELRSSRFFRGLFPGHTIELDGRIGSIAPWGDSSRVFFFDRYFIGGL
ncbi:MAG: outer membrane protein assembly factor BamA, partial [Verrucomicrobia bacterium]|nr:outer membrane protein assembly factor BamA [Verrucomicrobiota bacterium]